MAAITLRMDDKEKKELDKALEAIGMNVTTFYSIYTKKFLREKRIPFDITVPDEDAFYAETNQKHLKKAIKRLEGGKGQEHDLIED